MLFSIVLSYNFSSKNSNLSMLLEYKLEPLLI